MTSPVLKVENLVKKYGTFRAVDAISFSIPKGKIVGLLGPNGAGKTTTIKMAVGFLRPDSGDIKIFGEANSTKARRWPPSGSRRGSVYYGTAGASTSEAALSA